MEIYRHERNQISTNIISLSEKAILSHYSRLASATKKELIFYSHKKCLPFSKVNFIKFVGHPVELFLSHYELPLFGVVRKISEIKENVFEISIGFPKDTPLYYRECVADLLN